MTDTFQKLDYAYIMLGQAKLNQNDYNLFIANLDAFVTDARGVTNVMKAEFAHVKGFKEWYAAGEEERKKDPILTLFNKLRVDTTHVRPINAQSKINTTLGDGHGMRIGGGKIVEIPVGKVDEKGNLVIDNESPIIVNGEPEANVKRSTTVSYVFTERPQEDALTLCDTYIQKIQKLVEECHKQFKLE